MEKKYTVPFDRETAAQLKAGDCVYLTGTIYTARDAAHKRMQEALDRGEELPLSYIIWGLPLRERDRSSALPGQRRQAVWINIPPLFWIWAFVV